MDQVDRHSTRPKNRRTTRVIAAISGAGAITFALAYGGSADPVPTPPHPCGTRPGSARARARARSTCTCGTGRPRPTRHRRRRPAGAAAARRPARRAARDRPQRPGPAPGRPQRRADRQPGRRLQLRPSRGMGGIRRDPPGLRIGTAQQDFRSADAPASHHRSPTTPASCWASWTRSCTPALKPTTPRPQHGWHRTWVSSSCRTRAPA